MLAVLAFIAKVLINHSNLHINAMNPASPNLACVDLLLLAPHKSVCRYIENAVEFEPLDSFCERMHGEEIALRAVHDHVLYIIRLSRFMKRASTVMGEIRALMLSLLPDHTMGMIFAGVKKKEESGIISLQIMRRK